MDRRSPWRAFRRGQAFRNPRSQALMRTVDARATDAASGTVWVTFPDGWSIIRPVISEGLVNLPRTAANAAEKSNGKMGH
jgi:hypothetical protein